MIGNNQSFILLRMQNVIVNDLCKNDIEMKVIQSLIDDPSLFSSGVIFVIHSIHSREMKNL